MRKLPNGSTENRCERVDYFYDESGGANNGRLTRMRWGWDASNNPCVDAATNFNIGFEESYTYNAAGRTSTKVLAYRVGTNNTQQLAASWTYDNEGKLLTQSYPARSGQTGSNRTVDFSYDAMSRLQRVRSSWDWNISTYQDVAANAVYNHQGALTSLSILGSTETRQYNALGQLTRITGLGIDLEYRFRATQNDGKITQQKNWVSGEEVTYLYDELERLSSAATTSTAWGLAWSYDGFGNRLSQNLTKGTGPTNSTLVDANTNRISSFGYAYDANGNLTNMPHQNAQMTYDSSNRMTRFSDLNDAESYQYAPDNKRIWRSKGCTYYNQATGNNEPRPQIIFYSAFGQKLGEYCLTDNVTAVQEYVYFGGRMVAKTNIGGGPTLYSFKTDRLHSNQDAPGGGFFPFGETKSGAATTGESFATYSRDWHGLDYADQRWYAPGVGRFTTVDPSNSSAQKSEPLSWNRASYVENMPLDYLDPEGLASCRLVEQVFDAAGPRTKVHCVSKGGLLLEEYWMQTPFTDQNAINRQAEDQFGRALDEKELNQLKREDRETVFAMLEDPECRSIFGTESSRASGWDPREVLNKLFDGSSGLGRLTYNRLPILGAVAIANTSVSLVGFSIGAHIEINTDAWTMNEFSHNRRERALTILHELGHAYTILRLRGSGGSEIIPFDFDPFGYLSGLNDSIVASKCGIVRPMPRP